MHSKSCLRPAIHQPLAGPQHEELRAHKDRVSDKLQGLVTTVDRIPAVLHAESTQVRLGTSTLRCRSAARRAARRHGRSSGSRSAHTPPPPPLPPQIAVVSKALLAREAGIHKTKEVSAAPAAERATACRHPVHLLALAPTSPPPWLPSTHANGAAPAPRCPHLPHP
jgi:hypothetical protein